MLNCKANDLGFYEQEQSNLLGQLFKIIVPNFDHWLKNV
jgi:hypothetical protein